MRKFNLDEYDNSYVMWCQTEEEAKIFTKFLHDTGKRWRKGGSYLEKTHWEECKENLCYSFREGQYADIEFYEEEGYTILRFSDFDWSEIELLKDIPQKKLKRLLGMSREQLIKRIHILEYNIECLLNQIEED